MKRGRLNRNKQINKQTNRQLERQRERQTDKGPRTLRWMEGIGGVLQSETGIAKVLISARVKISLVSMVTDLFVRSGSNPTLSVV